MASTSHTGTGRGRARSGRGVVLGAVAINSGVGSVGYVAVMGAIVGRPVGVVGSASLLSVLLGLLLLVLGESLLDLVDDARHVDGLMGIEMDIVDGYS